MWRRVAAAQAVAGQKRLSAHASCKAWEVVLEDHDKYYTFGAPPLGRDLCSHLTLMSGPAELLWLTFESQSSKCPHRGQH